MSSGSRRYGRRVAAARGAKNWSTGDLARTAGLSKRTIESIEAGSRPSPATIGKLETALGWRPDSYERIVEGMEPQPVQDAELERLRQMWEQLTDEQRAFIIALAQTLIRQR